jgi:hypothetical protein
VFGIPGVVIRYITLGWLDCDREMITVVWACKKIGKTRIPKRALELKFKKGHVG